MGFHDGYDDEIPALSPLALPTLFARTLEIYTRFPPDCDAVRASDIMGARSCVFTYEEERKGGGLVGGGKSRDGKDGEGDVEEKVGRGGEGDEDRAFEEAAEIVGRVEWMVNLEFVEDEDQEEEEEEERHDRDGEEITDEEDADDQWGSRSRGSMWSGMGLWGEKKRKRTIKSPTVSVGTPSSSASSSPSGREKKNLATANDSNDANKKKKKKKKTTNSTAFSSVDWIQLASVAIAVGAIGVAVVYSTSSPVSSTFGGGRGGGGPLAGGAAALGFESWKGLVGYGGDVVEEIFGAAWGT